MICEHCGKTHEGTYGSGRFCSMLCARSFSTKQKRNDINARVSDKLTKKRLYSCVICSSIFEPSSKGNRVCSTECKSLSKQIAGKKAYNTMMLNGNHNGWKSRLGKQPSYPEQYFIDLFTIENINDYVREFQVDKWFIDFAFVDAKIAIEIDGKQHEYAERKIKDEEKDFHLINNGWTVLRIKWHNPRTNKGKELLYPQIENMKNILRFA